MGAMVCGGAWGAARVHALFLALALTLPAPSVNISIAAAGPMLPAAFAAGRGWGRAGLAGVTLSGEVDAECGCLLESSCTHGAAGVAAARQRLQLLEHERKHEERADDEMAFIRSMMFPGGDPVASERASVARSTCVREGLARRAAPLARGRLGTRMARSNSTSVLGEFGFRTAGSSLSVIAKRSARSWTPDGTGTRVVRSMRDVNHLVLHSDKGAAAYLHTASGDLTMMNKLVMPRLLSPSGLTGQANMRGELVARLRGLQGRYEVAKSEKPLLMLRKDHEDSEASSATAESSVVLAMDRDLNDGGATLGAFHAPQTTVEVHEVPPSDSWLEEGNTKDKVLPPIVAELLRRVAEEGDRAIEEDCEIVTTGKDGQRSAFHAQRRPKVTLADYAERMCKYGACSPGCLGLSLVYMDRFLRQTDDYRVTGLNVHRLLLSCVLVATKQWDDSHYNNAFWAKVGGVTNAELNSLERHLLAKLDFSLLVDKVEWDAYRFALLAWEGLIDCAHDCAGAETAARHKLAMSLQSPYLRKSRIFEWSRDALLTSSCADMKKIPAATTNMGYSPEGPGSNVLAADDERRQPLGPASEDIFLAAHRQMSAGIRARKHEPLVGQRLTGGANCVDKAEMPDFFRSVAHGAISAKDSAAAVNNIVPMQRSVFCPQGA